MQNCGECGTANIAAGLEACPHCYALLAAPAPADPGPEADAATPGATDDDGPASRDSSGADAGPKAGWS